jgi:plasmid stability protein
LGAITIRSLEEALKTRLRVRAAENNRSMEEEARQILRAALGGSQADASDLVTRMRARLVGVGDIELRIPPREPMRDPPDFSGPDFDLSASPAGHAASARKARPRRT